MDNQNTNAFAPELYKGLEEFKISMAVRGSEGLIIQITDVDNRFNLFFYSPKAQPQNFYMLDSWASGFDMTRDISTQRYMSLAFQTHDPDISLCFYKGRTGHAKILYSREWHTPQLDDWVREKKEYEVWKTLQKDEILDLQDKMKSNQFSFYSLPRDGYVDAAYALPDNHASLKGIIAFGRACYNYSTEKAEFVPFDATQPPQDIAFYKGDKRISNSEITLFIYQRPKDLTVSFNNATERQVINLKGTEELNSKAIEKLVKTGRISFVPKELTPLITPLLFKDTAPAPAVEASPAPPTLR